MQSTELVTSIEPLSTPGPSYTGNRKKGFSCSWRNIEYNTLTSCKPSIRRLVILSLLSAIVGWEQSVSLCLVSFVRVLLHPASLCSAILAHCPQRCVIEARDIPHRHPRSGWVCFLSERWQRLTLFEQREMAFWQKEQKTRLLALWKHSFRLGY
jgi:hypothetical protein